MWNGTMFVDLDWPLNASSLLSASAELLVLNKMMHKTAQLIFTKFCEGCTWAMEETIRF